MWFQAISIILLFSRFETYEIKCPKNGSFVHVKPLTECKEYYKCSEGSKKIFNCPEGTVYSSKDQECKASGICRELVCAGRVNGKYVDPIENCTRIYRCLGGELDYVQTCTDDGLKCPHNCPLLEQSTATVSIHRDICETRQNGFYALKDCSKYVECMDGREVMFLECPKGKKFNGSDCVENFECGNPCAFKPDGNRSDENCHEYVTCKNGKVSSKHRCPNGSFFDGISCIISHICPQKCLSKQNGLYADFSKNCSTYYECSEGTTHEKSCHNKVFDGTKCVSADKFYCHGPSTSSFCEGKNGYFWDQNSNCTKYHFCNFGLKFDLKCPKNEVFNGSTCVPKDKFLCPNSCKNLGYYQDIESKCRSYHFCIDGNKITYVCPKNKIFNGKECVSSSSYKCPYDVECEGKVDGYHVKDDEFYFCQNGTKLTTLKCGMNEDSICHFASNSETLCSEVKKGYVTDLNCRSYHKCSKFASVESGICKETEVYNGKICVTKDAFQCPRNSCKDLQNGFYQNFNSRCRKYFFCINGQKTELECPEGKIHNGDVCVDQLHYKCPKILTLNKTVFNFQ